MGSDSYKLVIIGDFISGVMFGIEFHMGEDLEPDDSFAMTIDLFIVRLTFIRTKGNTYD